MWEGRRYPPVFIREHRGACGDFVVRREALVGMTRWMLVVRLSGQISAAFVHLDWRDVVNAVCNQALILPPTNLSKWRVAGVDVLRRVVLIE